MYFQRRRSQWVKFGTEVPHERRSVSRLVTVVRTRSIVKSEGELHAVRYDFFRFNATAISGFRCERLVLAQHWCDHYLLICPISAGSVPPALLGPCADHWDHSKRWEPKNWRGFGSSYVHDANSASPRAEFSSKGRTEFHRAATSAVTYLDYRPLESIKLAFPRRKGKICQSNIEVQLCRVVAANVAYIDSPDACLSQQNPTQLCCSISK